MGRRPGLVAAGVLVIVLNGSGSSPGPPRASSRIAVAKDSTLPLRFEANEGQWDERVRFVARQRAVTVSVTDDGMTVALDARDAVTIRPVRATKIAPRGEEELATKSHYFVGNDPSRWRTNVASYARVRARGWAPGVDAVWYGEDGRVEYDLDVAAGVDARELELLVEGATRLELGEDGSLEAVTPSGTLVQRPPRVVQAGRELPARWVIAGADRVRFAITGYDARLALRVDPVLAYALDLGAASGPAGLAIAVDAKGSAYVTGAMTSAARVPADTDDVFVWKLSADGSSVVYATYLGGADTDIGYAIAVDGSGSAYVTGSTGSKDFPTRSPFQPTWALGKTDAFVTKLGPDGSSLVYSTFLGGWRADEARGIAIDLMGDAYVTGTTGSSDFPTKRAFQPTLGGLDDVFVTKLDAMGSSTRRSSADRTRITAPASSSTWAATHTSRA